MQFLLRAATLLLTIGSIGIPTPVWAAPRYKVLHAFGTGTDGGGLWSSVVFDKNGNLYGTTSGGGAYGYGTVFELMPEPGGEWAETILRSFKNNDSDGSEPTGGLVFGTLNTLYGTTAGGGASGYGTVFELTPGAGEWTETVLFSFPVPQVSHKVGCCPQSGLIIGPRGSLYGTTSAAYELTHGSNGWKMAILHVFGTGANGDGSGPSAEMTRDIAGNLYGTTEGGGTSTRCDAGCGTVYEIAHMPDGAWKESVLHSFSARNDGSFPGFGDKLAIDSSGNLYGTALGGVGGHGVIFRMNRDSNGVWKETILHSIYQAVNGDGPSSGVVMDKAGNLYGTTIAGGTASCGCGVVYKLSPGPNDTWTYTVLHRFTGFDGAEPDANLTLDDKGNIYGTTATGGAGGAGVVFEVTP